MRSFLISLLVSLLVAALAVAYLKNNPDFLGKTETTAAAESTYDRVMRTGTIHCGYSVWSPLFFIDSKTNDKVGIFHDVMEEVGKRLGLKIIWQEELGWGTAIELIKTRRVDMACAGYWVNQERIKHLLPSAPLFYAPMYVWIRQDDTHNFKSLDDLNSDQVTAAMIDGSAEKPIIAKRFPKAKTFSMSEMSTNSDSIQNVVTRKADFMVYDSTTLAAYMENNPGKIKNAFPNQPLVIYPTSMLLPPDDVHFKEVIDNTLRSIEYDGTLDEILKTYHMENAFLRNPMPIKSAP